MPEYIWSRPIDGTEYVTMPTAILEQVYGHVEGGDLEWVRGIFSTTEPDENTAPTHDATIVNGNRNWEFDQDIVGWQVELGVNWIAVWVQVLGEPVQFDKRQVIGINPEDPPVDVPPVIATSAGTAAAQGSRASKTQAAAAPAAPAAATSLPGHFALRLDREYISGNVDEISTLFNARIIQAEPIILSPDISASVPGSKLVYSATRSTDNDTSSEDPTTQSKWFLEIPDPAPPLWIAKVYLLQATDAAFESFLWYKIRFNPAIEQLYISGVGSPYQVRISPA